MPTLTAEEASALLKYSPDTGAFEWRDPSRASASCGRLLNGYLRISLGAHGVFYAHRLAWLISTRKWPEGILDHADGDRANNALSNLRAATYSQNNANSRRPKNNTTGYKGVTRYRGKYRAQISVAGARHWLGDFDSTELAAAAYRAASCSAYGTFSRTTS